MGQPAEAVFHHLKLFYALFVLCLLALSGTCLCIAQAQLRRRLTHEGRGLIERVLCGVVAHEPSLVLFHPVISDFLNSGIALINNLWIAGDKVPGGEHHHWQLAVV